MDKREKIGKGNPPKATRFKPGNNANPNGRPRKFICALKDAGYRLSHVTDTIQTMMAMTLDDLKGVYENKEATVLEKTIASAIRKSIERGDLGSIETLLTRVFGKPKEKIEHLGGQSMKLVFNQSPGCEPIKDEQGD